MSIDYTKHKDKRINNPTIEERGFFTKEELKPYDTRYQRDPSLDPQLVWKGKEEQNLEDLAVPTVPIYIQEKIHPQAIIEDLRRESETPAEQKDTGQFELSLFADFNGLEAEDELDKFQKSTEFYQHEKNWTNRMILGDSLLVMNSLAEKEGLRGKVQMIYIDPPYGIKFGSNWQVSTRKRDVKDGKAEDAAHEPEVIRAFRDTWALGIHSYLSYLRDRFETAHELLSENGSIFVQIGEENVHLVRCLLDETFGSENFVSLISYATTGGFETAALSRSGDYIIWYAKAKSSLKFRNAYFEKSEATLKSGDYRYVECSDGRRAPLKGGTEKDQRVFRLDNTISQGPAPNPQPFDFEGKTFRPRSGTHWKANYPAGMERLGWARRLVARQESLAYVRFLDDFPLIELTNIWTDTSVAGTREGKWYVVQTNAKVIERCLLMATDPGDLVLDPTCGSGTTAYVAEQWGRRWITIDTSRVSLALARTRLMSARFPYYLLADSPEGVKKESEITGQMPPTYQTNRDIKKGFVYKRVPHVTLKSIANNPDIHEGMSREEIDKAIARHAETELLYDQPYVDSSKIRVTGPFTVESLSPHRTLAADAESEFLPGRDTRHETQDISCDASHVTRHASRAEGASAFTTTVLDNLKKAGVQNTKKQEKMKLEEIQPFAGQWVNATGTFTDATGATKRVAISIGPEYGAVSPMQVKEAAKEAMQGIGHDILVVCGYAFDPHVTEEARQFGALTVLPTRMNADLAMGDDLLKKTGAGNLFMVFGEPDLNVRKENGKIVVQLNGLDVFDPTTGEIRSNSTDDIACWFIDTAYNGESFFVRHAYFTGADEPYEKLKKALRAEIDEAAWSTLYSTTSRPFGPPITSRIAVKVINHYGDEVLKVYKIE